MTSSARSSPPPRRHSMVEEIKHFWTRRSLGALHVEALWGHLEMCEFLIEELNLDVNAAAQRENPVVSGAPPSLVMLCSRTPAPCPTLPFLGRHSLLRSFTACSSPSPTLAGALNGASLQDLYQWRDSIAREQDESTGYVLPNKALIEIANEMPTTAEDLRSILKSRYPVVEKKMIES